MVTAHTSMPAIMLFTHCWTTEQRAVRPFLPTHTHSRTSNHKEDGYESEPSSSKVAHKTVSPPCGWGDARSLKRHPWEEGK